jgi:probable addiction module antidote protein
VTIETTKWDSADYLDTEEDIEAYLEAAREENDPALMEHGLKAVERARARWQMEGGSS